MGNLNHREYYESFHRSMKHSLVLKNCKQTYDSTLKYQESKGGSRVGNTLKDDTRKMVDRNQMMKYPIYDVKDFRINAFRLSFQKAWVGSSLETSLKGARTEAETI